VLSNKLLFLLAWDVSRAHLVSIQPGKAHYRSAMGAAVISLPAGTPSVTVIISGVWRSQRLVIPLRHITPDPSVLNWVNESVAGGVNMIIRRFDIAPSAFAITVCAIRPSIMAGKPSIQNIHPIYHYYQFNDYVP